MLLSGLYVIMKLPPFLTDKELEERREQFKKVSELAAEAARKLGIKVHPRIAALRKCLTAPTKTSIQTPDRIGHIQ